MASEVLVRSHVTVAFKNKKKASITATVSPVNEFKCIVHVWGSSSQKSPFVSFFLLCVLINPSKNHLWGWYDNFGDFFPWFDLISVPFEQFLSFFLSVEVREQLVQYDLRMSSSAKRPCREPYCASYSVHCTTAAFWHSRLLNNIHCNNNIVF